MKYANLVKRIDEIIVPTTKLESYLLDVIFLPILSLPYVRAKTILEPMWIMVVAPPGSGKTLRVRLFEDLKQVITLSTMSSKSLVSGYRDDSKKDPSLLPTFDGNCLVIKDFTAMLQMGKESRDAIIGQFRDAYDGAYANATGYSGRVAYKSMFNFIACTTFAIDAYHSVTAPLGDRFILARYIPKTLRSMVEQTVLEGGESKVKEYLKLQVACKTFLKGLKYTPFDGLTKKIPKDLFDWVLTIADIVPRMKMYTPKEISSASITAMPQLESPIRLMRQFFTIINMMQILYQGKPPWKRIRGVITWLARSTVESLRAFMAFKISRHESKWIDLASLKEEVAVGNRTLNNYLTDFRLSGMVEQRWKGVNKRGTEVRIAEKYLHIFHDPDFEEGMEMYHIEAIATRRKDQTAY